MKSLIVAAGLALLPFAAGAAVITNGNVMLGVNATGSLNTYEGTSSPVMGTQATGLRYTPTGNEATSHGCLCEGWGVGNGDTGVWGADGGANTGGPVNLTVASFTSTASTAKSVVDLASGGLRVTHDFALAQQTDNLYRVRVSITNTSGVAIKDLRYTRAMDWDIEPTAFNEFSTIQGTAKAANVLYANDDGFDSTNPFDERRPILASGDFVDAGAGDIGALFDFGFGELAADGTFTFDIFYGGASTETEALLALSKVGAEVYSLGQSALDMGGEGGEGFNTFVFGFAGVGGEVVLPPSAVPVPATAGLLLGGLGLLGAVRARRRA